MQRFSVEMSIYILGSHELIQPTATFKQYQQFNDNMCDLNSHTAVISCKTGIILFVSKIFPLIFIHNFWYDGQFLPCNLTGPSFG